MRYSNQGRFREQARFLRCQFLQDGDLPFSNVLSEAVVAQALTAISACWLDRIYSPLVTLWVFLSQVLSADHSCRAAVACLIAHRVSRGQCPCSSETGAYCQARKRLPEEFFSNVARQTGRALEMLRTLWQMFLPGDVMLADRLMCTWTEMVMLKQRGVDCVCRLTSHRNADFRRGKRLGKDDHVVQWLKPTKPRSIDRETYNALPEFLMIRECRIQVEQPGFRVRTLIVATTLLVSQ